MIEYALCRNDNDGFLYTKKRYCRDKHKAEHIACKHYCWRHSWLGKKTCKKRLARISITPALWRFWRSDCLVHSPLCLHTSFTLCPADTRRWTNVGLMLVQRRRRWASLKPALVQCLVFSCEMMQFRTDDFCNASWKFPLFNYPYGKNVQRRRALKDCALCQQNVQASLL